MHLMVRRQHPRYRKIRVAQNEIDSPFVIYEKTGCEFVKREVRLYEYWAALTNAQKKRAIANVKRRCEIKKLLAEPLCEAAIARKIGVSREMVRLYKNSFEPERPDGLQGRLVGIVGDNRQKIIETVVSNPKQTRKQIGDSFDVCPDTVSKVLKDAKIKKKQPAERSPEECAERKHWLEEHGISSSRGARISTSVADMENRYQHVLKRHGYEITDYLLVAKTSERFDAHAANLERHGIDWKNDELGLYRLVSNSPAYVDRQMSVLNSVGATADLHYLLLKKLDGKINTFNSEDYAAMREAVVKNDLEKLFSLAGRITSNNFAEKNWRASKVFFEASQGVLLDVLSNCNSPGNNPAAVLALVAAAIEIKMHAMRIEEAATRSLEEYTDVSADQNIRPIRKSRN